MFSAKIKRTFHDDTIIKINYFISNIKKHIMVNIFDIGLHIIISVQYRYSLNSNLTHSLQSATQ